MQAPDNAVIQINVTDCNDHPPVFINAPYEFRIDEGTEGTPGGSVVFSGINTTDDDGTTPNQVVVYSLLDGTSSTNGWFNILRSTVSSLALTFSHAVKSG